MTSTGILVKDFLRSAVTGSRSPEETLQQLDSVGVDWQLTEKGHLMIRYWQVGAEGFVSPEQVGTIIAGRATPTVGPALEWVSRNLEVLRQRHAGEWIAVAGNQVVAHAQTLSDLLTQLPPVGADRPFVTQIPAAPVIWHATYAG